MPTPHDAHHDAQLERVFLEAVELPAEEQRGYVESAFVGDGASIRRIFDLIRADSANADGALEQSAHGLRELAPVRLGQYRLIRQLNQGGMGTIYEALQDRPSRSVALKVIRAGLATPRVLRRFELESEALAALRHPGVVHVYEAGVATAEYTDGTRGQRPFIAMELIDGTDILTDAQQRSLGLPEKLQLFAQVCDAVHHAHQHGVIHRDLKPANILVDRSGQPKVLDFGVARLALPGNRGRPGSEEAGAVGGVDHPGTLTLEGQVIGTPRYLSPDHSAPGLLGADVRSDVYSLGVILHELLVGDAGVHPSKVDERPRVAARPPSAFPRDVETIVQTARAVEADRRYQSAAEFAADLRRCVAGEPISAHPASPLYRAHRFVGRNRLLVGAVVAGAGALLVGGGVAAWQAVRATREAAHASVSLREAGLARAESDATLDFLTDMLVSADPSELGRDVLVRDVLDRAAASVGANWPNPLVEARERDAIGCTYEALGEFARAREQLETAWDIRRERLGDDDPLTLHSEANLAAVLNTLGEHDRAESLFSHAYQARLRRGGPADRETIAAMGDLAGVHQSRQRFAEAEELFRAAVGRMAEAGGPASKSDLAVQSKFAALLYRLGKSEEAERVYERLLPAQEAMLGADNLSTLRTVLGAAGNARSLGRLARSEELHLRVVRGRERILGPDHPETLGALNDLALLYSQQKKLEEAEPLFQRVLAGATKTLGAAHRNTLKTRFNLAQAYLLAEQYERARPMLEETLADQRRAFGERNVDVADSLRVLADLRVRMGDDEGAAGLYAQSIEAFSRAVSLGYWMVGSMRSDRGACLTRLKRFDEAEQELRAAVTAIGASTGGQRGGERLAWERLGACCEAAGHVDAAADCRKQMEHLPDYERSDERR